MLVRRRLQQYPVQGFHRPVAICQFVGQPIEQFGVRGQFTTDAEVVRGDHNATAEMALPHTIDQHPRSQRIALICDPSRQLKSATRFRFDSRVVLSGNDLQEASRGLCSQRLIVPAQMDTQIGCLGLIPDGHHTNHLSTWTGNFGFDPHRIGCHVMHDVGTHKNTGQRIIILGGDGIELVVMTTCATNS